MSEKEKDLFGLDDLFVSDGEASGHGKSVVGVIIRSLLAITTMGFFYLYVGNLFTWIAGEEYSPYISALVGAFAIDYMAFYWDRLRRSGSTTEAQMTAGKMMTILNLGLSALVTIVFFVLGTDFVATTDASGAMNDVGLVVNLLGLLVGIIALAGNGIAWAYFEAQDISAKEAIARTQMIVAQLKGLSKINKSRAELQISATMAGITDGLAEITTAVGNSNAEKYKSGLKSVLSNNAESGAEAGNLSTYARTGQQAIGFDTNKKVEDGSTTVLQAEQGGAETVKMEARETSNKASVHGGVDPNW